MDYTKQNKFFLIKKTLRYLKLYGLTRTLIKIKGQFHMSRKYVNLPLLSNSSKKQHIGLLGSGNYAFSVIAYYLKMNFGKVIKSSMDIEINRAASFAVNFGLSNYTSNSKDIIYDPDIKLVYIASNHYTHAEYAIEALKENKSVHIEKPHVVNRKQLDRLIEVLKKSKGKIRLGFNRPASRFGKLIFDYLKKEKGTVMINWFIAGHKIEPSHWYFNDKERGRVLGNLCHWTDFTYHMIDDDKRYPIKIIPARSEKADCADSISYIFGDGSIASITFSAKGHTFEGVREKLNVQKGDTLISMTDFETMSIDVVDKKKVYKNFFRDHGHQNNVKRSYEMISKNKKGESLKYIYESADLFLKTKEALDTQKTIIVYPYEKNKK